MKVAIAGKGGAGKTTLCALLCREFARRGYSVLAVDADPDANLAAALGFPDAGRIKPIGEMKDLIKERAGDGGGFVRLNPRVDDIPATHSVAHDGVKLIVMGGVERAGGGCACPENVFLKELLRHILTRSDEIVMVDMEAGIEHLGRATAESVDLFLVVVEPSLLSLRSAETIGRLARELKVKRIAAVANKTESEEETGQLHAMLEPLDWIGAVPFSRALRSGGMSSAKAGEDPALGEAVSRIAGSIMGGGAQADQTSRPAERGNQR